jgi:mRNA interferase RelE/StbE
LIQVRVKKNFLKQLSKLPSEFRLPIERFIFDELPKFDSLSEAGNIEKMHEYKDYYKIRFGSYRVGLKVEHDNSITILKVMHRRDIYRFFP